MLRAPALKRAMDFVVALIALIAFAIPMFFIALAIRARMGAPVVFRQRRPGLGAKPFFIYKFRTMSDRRDEHGELLPDAERMTALGGFLRDTSLDELPALYNVLKGEMSLVGPRPLLMRYLELYTSEQARRHDVRPGLTGLAQVKGRNAISWEARFAYDTWYVDNWNLWLDVRILCATMIAVLRREGVRQPGRVTVDYFTGTQAPADSARAVRN